MRKNTSPSKSNIHIVERGKIGTQTRQYMPAHFPAHFPVLVHTPEQEVTD